jgi:hypothetical protein
VPTLYAPLNLWRHQTRISSSSARRAALELARIIYQGSRLKIIISPSKTKHKYERRCFYALCVDDILMRWEAHAKSKWAHVGDPGALVSGNEDAVCDGGEMVVCTYSCRERETRSLFFLKSGRFEAVICLRGMRPDCTLPLRQNEEQDFCADQMPGWVIFLVHSGLAGVFCCTRGDAVAHVFSFCWWL